MMKPTNIISRSVVFLVVSALQADAGVPNHHLFYRSDNRAPITRLGIVFPGAGSNRDGHTRNGLAETVAELIVYLAKKHGHMARLEGLGGILDVDTYYEYQAISMTTLSRNLDASIEIVRGLIQHTEFSDFDVHETKRRLGDIYDEAARSGLHGLVKNYALARTIGMQKFYSRNAMDDLTPEEVREYYAGFSRANVVYFKTISDLDSMTIRESLAPIMASRETGGFVHSAATRENERLPGHSALVFEHYSHLKSLSGYWLIPCGTVGEDNYVPNMVCGALGGFPARGLLFRHLREELGLVYGTRCESGGWDGIRSLEIYANSRLENSEELILKMHDIITGLADRPRFWETVAELRQNPDFANAGFHEEFTLRRQLTREVDQAIYNYPRREDAYKAVTEDEIRSFLEKYFVAENMVMVLFGPKDHIVEILEKHWPEITIHVQPVEKAIE